MEFVRHSVAVMCMALAVMLSGQTYISLMDRIDHAHNHVHFANPAGGRRPILRRRPRPVAARITTISMMAAARTTTIHPAAIRDISTATSGSYSSRRRISCFRFVMFPRRAANSEPRTLASISPRGPDHPPKSSLAIRA
jgi:hypothetical protein